MLRRRRQRQLASCRLSVATVAAAGADQRGFGNVEATACRDLDATAGGELVPPPELGQRDAESISDGNQGVAAAGGVVDGVRRWGGSRRDRHDESLDTIELRRSASNWLAAASVGDRNAIGVRDGRERVVRRDLVIAPRIALALGNGGDLLLEERGGACGQMQIEAQCRAE